MVNFGDVGRICLNGEITGICQNCLWLEWDSLARQCLNQQFPVCQMYREWLLSTGQPARMRTLGQANPGAPPSGAGLPGLPGAKAEESGIS
jgi:hypothetical protein